MKTRIVYVVTSNEADYYLEQTLISILSVKLHSPESKILLVVDEATSKLLCGTRQRLKELTDQIIVASTPEEYSNVQKSRFIKTSLRKLIAGDFLFIDSDTVITSTLKDIDNINISIGAVKDKHLDISEHNWKNLIGDWAKSVEWTLTPNDKIYFNSGVFYVKDNYVAHNLYEKWHQFWLDSNRHGLSIDQPALGKANSVCGYVIKELPGEWNCQILENGLRFLADAKIIHFFSSTLNNKAFNSAYKLKDVSLYERLRCRHDIPEEIMRLIEKPKSAFKQKTILLSDDEIDLMSTPLYQKLKCLYLDSPSKFKFLENSRLFIGKFTRFLHLR